MRGKTQQGLLLLLIVTVHQYHCVALAISTPPPPALDSTVNFLEFDIEKDYDAALLLMQVLFPRVPWDLLYTLLNPWTVLGKLFSALFGVSSVSVESKYYTHTYRDWTMQFVHFILLSCIVWVLFGFFGFCIIRFAYLRDPIVQTSADFNYTYVNPINQIFTSLKTSSSSMSYKPTDTPAANVLMELYRGRDGGEAVAGLDSFQLLHLFQMLQDVFDFERNHVGVVNSLGAWQKKLLDDEKTKQGIIDCLSRAPQSSSNSASSGLAEAYLGELQKLLSIDDSDAKRLLAGFQTMQIDGLLSRAQDKHRYAISNCPTSQPVVPSSRTLAKSIDRIPTHSRLAQRVFDTKKHVANLLEKTFAGHELVSTSLRTIQYPVLSNDRIKKLESWLEGARDEYQQLRGREVPVKLKFLKQSMKEYARLTIDWITTDKNDKSDDQSHAIIGMALAMAPKDIKSIMENSIENTQSIAFLARASDFLDKGIRNAVQIFQILQPINLIDALTFPRLTENVSKRVPGNIEDLSAGNRISLVMASNERDVMDRLTRYLWNMFAFVFFVMMTVGAMGIYWSITVIQTLSYPCFRRNPSNVGLFFAFYLPPPCPLYGDATFADWDADQIQTDVLPSEIRVRCWEGITPIESRTISRTGRSRNYIVTPPSACPIPRRLLQECSQPNLAASACASERLNLACPDQDLLVITGARYSTAQTQYQGHVCQKEPAVANCQADLLTQITEECALGSECSIVVEGKYLGACAGIGGGVLTVQYGCLDYLAYQNVTHRPWPWQIRD